MTIAESILWRATANPVAEPLQLSEPVSADVAIVGCGIMGVMAALTLARLGASVVVLEAARIGEGASSRPGGFVVPTFSFGGPREVTDQYGEVGARLVQATAGGADRVFALTRELGIDCDARQGGWYQPAHGAKAWQRVQKVAGEWRSEGVETELLDSEATAQRTGVEGYEGSWAVASGGTLHPLNYTLGLAGAARRAGVRIFEHTPAVSLSRKSRSFVIGTPCAQAPVTAEKVIFCCNARTAGLTPGFNASVVPMKIWQAASEPIPSGQRAHLFQRGESLSDTRENLFTYRFDRDWRLITGHIDAAGMSRERIAHRMMCRLQRHLNLERVPMVEHLWSGVASVTRSRLPQIELSEGGRIVSATACNGRGIALSTVVGEAIGRFAASGNSGELPVPVIAPRGGLDVILQKILSPFYVYYACLKDWGAKPG